MAFVLDICIALIEEVYAPWEGQGKACGGAAGGGNHQRAEDQGRRLDQ
jgi:hypothetical protein